jgi:hypothetical protein
MSTGAFFKFPTMSRRLHAGPLLGHESVETTQIHSHAHLALRRRRPLADSTKWQAGSLPATVWDS